jgi:hypothetical protein
MKTTIIVFFFTFVCALGISQTWSEEQLSNANTVKDIDCLTDSEKEAIVYINLARLYPKDFANISKWT